MLNALLFNSSARMYNLRILLLITIALIPTRLIVHPEADSKGYIVGIDIATSCLILAHHILRLFASKLIAILDLCLTLVEVCMVAYLADFSIANYAWSSSSIILRLTLVAHPIQLTSLLISLIWSTATIMKSPQKIMHQYFKFLGSCSQPRGPYTPLRILTNRSASKPLVRGEFRGIAIIRAIFLSILCIALPTVGVYTIIVVPMNAQAFTRQVLTNFAPFLGRMDTNIGSNLGIILCGQSADLIAEDDTGRPYLDVKVNGADCPALNFIYVPEVACRYTSPAKQEFIASLWSCITTWQDVQTIDITVHFDSSESIATKVTPVIYVQLGQGDFNDIARYTEPVAFMPNAHLFATLTWTEQQLMSSASVIGGLALASKNVLTSELHTLQADTRFLPHTTWDPTNSTLPDSTLSIVQAATDPVKFVQQYTETSALNGLATIGGFWTFVNGAFALFFGANVVYFLFGRRPLTALGIVHIFQRKALIRKWHEDFPALHSEGSRPGSEGAGIVAFVRERLVDVDEDYIHGSDLEAQKSSNSKYATLRPIMRETDDNNTIDDT
ncbi:hypothetical protein MSAN_00239700 [Mycena sanguinolenta]|uniref:Uncharacterized protein n=1 Tax=Mycena sanguinolenta TaxID=230812 RepID=A0A8H6ZI00_9AGAR|nr:hypothetical protein MSAN_00239700 [Mycena sanguinolenta]